MKMSATNYLITAIFIAAVAQATAPPAAGEQAAEHSKIGPVEIVTVALNPEIRLNSATYTPSGKVLVAYLDSDAKDERDISLAVVDDSGENMRTFFSQRIPERAQDNGIRYMVFPDNQRIFLGDFILECTPDIDRCAQSVLYPVHYPNAVAGGDHLSHRWSEIIVAPDNRHIAWTTLFSNYSAAMFIGTLSKGKNGYTIVDPRIISTLDAFPPDPRHADGVLPNPVRNGEVKQFVRGGTGISLVGAKDRDTADSVVQDLASDDILQITHTPGYDETTIFSPDERLGIVMSSRFSAETDLAILGLMPKPYPAGLNMGLNMHAYIHAVAGVRSARHGNIGPALIDIEASRTQAGYRGINLNTQDEWVYLSPMSWHPDGKKAMWLEGRRGTSGLDTQRRIQVVELPQYETGPAIASIPVPEDIPYATDDLTRLEGFLAQTRDTDVKVYGAHSGYIVYRRTAKGWIEKTYADFSDDGEHVYNGSETMQLNPQGNSTYTAQLKLSGPDPGEMDLKITFGPLQDRLPARIIFDRDEAGKPLSHGFAEYGGERLYVEDLIP